MGSFHKASCPCGFETSVVVGGNRETYMKESTFPFFCEEDGLISVNFRKKPFTCDCCKSIDIKQYGTPPISLPPTGELPWPAIQAWDFQAYREGNLCPKCKKMTLIFGGSEIRFD
jgi:hypothetical protein